MLKPLANILLLLAVLACLIGCSRSAVNERQGSVVELNFWNGFSGPDGAQMEKLVADFNRKHEGKIKVRMQIIPWGTYYDKVTLSLAYGGAPQVFVLHVNRFPEFASRQVLGDFDDLIQQSKFPTDDLVAKAWASAQWKGKTYALPLDVHPLGLYYNLDLFEKAGIKTPPATFDEFMRDAKKLTHDGQWGFAFTWLHSNSLCILNQFGADLLSQDLTKSGLDTPEATQAMNRMVEIIDSGVCPKPEGQDAWLGFQTGKVAMVLEGVYMMKGLEKTNLRFATAPVPQFGPKQAVWAGTHMLTMPAGLDSKTRQASWEFIHFLSDNSLVWADGGQVPARKSLLASPEFQSKPIQRQFARQVDYVQYEPKSVEYNLVATFGDSAYEAILNKTESVDSALKTASRRINNRLQQP